MSGGVDSTVSAALLAEAGHEVIGLSMQLYDQRSGEAQFGSCCTIDDLHDARRAAQQIGIPHYIVNFEGPFRTHVIDNFISEYLAGRTPIPCTHCNSDVKFATLLDRAAGLGAERLATGHYVRVAFDDARGQYVLRRGSDHARDQAYFLFSLTQDQLAQALFPVGDMTKDAVRAYARDRKLLTADKRDSHEICFVPHGDYAAFVEREAGVAMKPGVIRDGSGRVLATHDGVQHFTIGQRKGLKLSAGVPLYVNAIDAATATVTVGPRESIEHHVCEVTRVNWIAGTPPPLPRRAHVQIRHRHDAAAAILTPTAEDGVCVTFDEAQSAITPGQAAVFYDGDEVLGGGWIAAAR